MWEKWNHFNNKQKTLSLLLTAGIVLIALAAVIFLFKKPSESANFETNTTVIETTAQTASTMTAEAVTTMDFSEWKSMNEDVFAYIHISGTNIDYPIVYDENEYYLNRTIEGEYNYHGAIFVQKEYNTNTFKDKNTLIYGHNLIDNTMFSQLHRYEDEQFFNENREINIYTEDKNLKYKIFAAVQFTDTHIMYQYKFENFEQMEQFLSDLKSEGTQSIYDDTVEIKEDDCIITLSTCANGNQPNNRWLVLAVLEKEA